MNVRLGSGDRGFTVDADQFLRRPLSEVFPFFADARNLERLTPPILKFQVLTPGEIAMHSGALIDYKLTIRGVPVRWRTEITEWDPPHRFCDRQLKGPYRFWIHTHRFEERDGGTRVFDHVDYAVPGGAIVNRLLVAPDVKRIFTFRQQALDAIFG